MDERLNLMLDSEEADRIEQLRGVIYRDDPAQRARGPLNKSDVGRLALAEGLAVLEARYGVAERESVDFQEAL